ncbi:Zinc finger protein [Neofusicoccum parvum]|nr:Zinc finger protein [Neofusicoccum parvum]
MSSPRNPSQQTDNIEPWLIAKENFWKGLSREQQKAFPLPRPETVKRDIDELQRNTNSKTRACLMKCSPFFEGVRSFDAVISPIAGLEPHGIGALVWGSVTICLNLIKEYTEVFTKIEDFLTGVGDQLGRLEVYKDLYKTKTPTRLSSALVRVFEKYLAFFSHVKEFLEASKFKHVKDSFGFSRHDNNKQQLVKLSMELVTAECENAVAEAGVAEAQARASSSQAHGDALNRIDEKLDLVHGAIDRVQDSAERMRRAEVFSNYLVWLKHVDVDTRLKDLLRPKESVEAGAGASTSSWIFADERFKNWITPGKDSNHILWLTGDPGVGKSTLAAYISTELQKWQPTGVAYFFCTYQNANTRTVVAILRSWIWQLLRKPRHLSKASSGHLTLPEDEYDSTQSEDPSCDVMCDVMHQLYQQRRPTTLIVDGLDECQEPLKDTAEEQDWENFFELLRDAPEEWKILLVSRPRTWFRKTLLRTLNQKSLEREIVSADNSADIETFVGQKLQSLAKSNGWDDQLTQDAARVLVDHADGMFLYLWIILQKGSKDFTNGR